VTLAERIPDPTFDGSLPTTVGSTVGRWLTAPVAIGTTVYTAYFQATVQWLGAQSYANTNAYGDARDLQPTPWYQLPGMEGMRLVVQRVKHEARAEEPRATFSAPTVERVGEDDGAESTYAVLTVYLPTDVDRMAFRDRFYGRLAELRPEDLSRLAIGVGQLE
jgi:hypothetical protein